MTDEQTGTLYVVATPIGNRGDLAPRALTVLRDAAAIVAEDTRQVQRLMSGAGEPSGQRVSLNAHNEAGRIPGLLERLATGEDLALVSDAGAPAVSDPGGRLVEAAHGAGIPVRTIPGPSAVTALLAVAGLPADRFVFEGFLPTKEQARQERIRQLARSPDTTVLFESPRRLALLLAALAEACGPEREAVVGRELTKHFEDVRRGPLGELAEHYAAAEDEQRGELVLAVRGSPVDEEEAPPVDADTVLASLLEELPPSRAARVAARITNVSRKSLYERALAWRGAD